MTSEVKSNDYFNFEVVWFKAYLLASSDGSDDRVLDGWSDDYRFVPISILDYSSVITFPATSQLINYFLGS